MEAELPPSNNVMLDMCRAAAIIERVDKKFKGKPVLKAAKKGQDPDPRIPKEVCIEEGIEPH